MLLGNPNCCLGKAAMDVADWLRPISSVYWGSLGNEGARFETINWTWTEQGRDRYAEYDV